MTQIELLRISKRFGTLSALDEVSVRLAGGRVHGLLGENGAGKTTLMNILYGLVRADSGQIRRDGVDLRLRHPHDAIAAGIGMVHQHFMLAGPMTVIDNVLLGESRQGWILQRRRAARRLRELGEDLGLGVDPLQRIDRLSVGQQQRVEILKALFRDVQLLILDEPTAVLTPQQTTQLFSAIQRLRDAGKSVVFISHKLAEVKRICDDLTVLRRGRVVWEGSAASVSAGELALQMVGREVEGVALARQGEAPPRDGGTLSLKNVCAGLLREVNLEVRGGEIVGVAGVDGNGQQELAEVVVGLRGIRSGRMDIAGRDVTGLALGAARRPQVAHIPTDRSSQGLVPTMSIAENLLLKDHAHAPYARGGWIAWGRVRRMAGDLMQRFDIRAAWPQTCVAQLSGGNQQKVILARNWR